MISPLELRHIIETAFLPTKCVCSICADNRMTVQLLDADTEKEELTVIGVDSTKLVSSHAIVTLVAELKEEARMRRVVP
ncbi:DUF1652 domain-containing protein [Pseudomonas brassicacearum]|uniref:DUF1652 domain-containing protein n=1 Tax=Pseudomonas brassicacearum TaxID=930166 RepID=A0A423JXG9_9PSED|nr:DUF1652 domain-containing protein [Pseudomonas brassicacearum]RON42377.1 hypothetical protein BK664_01995 [Pseudomonas brassicacearum]